MDAGYIIGNIGDNCCATHLFDGIARIPFPLIRLYTTGSEPMSDRPRYLDRRTTVKFSGALLTGAILAGCLDDDPEEPAAPEDDDMDDTEPEDDELDDEMDDDEEPEDDEMDDEEDEQEHTLTVTVVEADDHEEENALENGEENGEQEENGEEEEEDPDEPADGEPIEGATVTIEDEEGPVSGVFDGEDEAQTDMDGVVEAQLADGQYTVMAEHEEYDQGQEDVEIAGMDEEVTIELQPMNGEVEDDGMEENGEENGDDEEL